MRCSSRVPVGPSSCSSMLMSDLHDRFALRLRRHGLVDLAILLEDLANHLVVEADHLAGCALFWCQKRDGQSDVELAVALALRASQAIHSERPTDRYSIGDLLLDRLSLAGQLGRVGHELAVAPDQSHELLFGQLISLNCRHEWDPI